MTIWLLGTISSSVDQQSPEGLAGRVTEFGLNGLFQISRYSETSAQGSMYIGRDV